MSDDTVEETSCSDDDDDEGKCPLHIALIREVLEYIHDHLRFILTRHGLGESDEIRPAKLSIYAILNARLMDDFKDVLLGQSFRERMWAVVKRSRAYDDIQPWLRANRCRYIYNRVTMKTANEYGIYRYADGGVYEGDWRNGKYNGQGSYTYAGGDIYEGEWRDGKRHDQGKYTYINGDVYEGCWKDGDYHGQGKISYPDGEVYEGEWRDGKRHGQGRYTCNNGDVYEGGWRDGKYHGQGRYTYANGNVLKGEWKDDKKHGQGKYTYANSKYHGRGKYTWTVHEGSYKDGRRHGQGKSTYDDDDDDWDYGMETWPDSRVYGDDWKGVKRHDIGKQTLL